MKFSAIVIAAFVLIGCAHRSEPTINSDVTITPRGDMPERFRVKAMYSDPSDKLLSRYNDFADAINMWVWDYARGMNNTRAAENAEKLFDRLSSTNGWSPRPRYELEQPCEVK